MRDDPSVVFYRKFFRHEWAQAIGMAQAIGEQDTVQVVDLVLQDLREIPFGIEAHRTTMQIFTTDLDHCRTGYMFSDETRQTEAALGPERHTIGAGYPGVEQS